MTFRFRRIRPTILLSAGLMVSPGCTDKSPSAPRDSGSPFIEIRFPIEGGSYDRDGDGLIDIEVAFSDSLSGIDIDKVELLTNRSVKGPAGSSANLLEHWTVVRADSAGFVVEETVENLLPRGAVNLIVRISDRAGNIASESIRLDLAPASSHKIVDLRASLFLTANILVHPDGERIYVTTEERDGTALTVLDGETFEVVKVERNPLRGGSRMALDESRNRLYAMSIDHPGLLVFDLGTETFLSTIPTSFRGIGIALSEQRRKAYVGLEVEIPISGLISVVDVDAEIEETVFDLGIGGRIPGDRMGMNSLVFDEGEARLFAISSNFAEQGILIVDPDTGALMGQIDLEPTLPPILGGGIDMIRNGQHLVVTKRSRDGVGRLAVVDMDEVIPTRFARFASGVIPTRVSASPNGDEYGLILVNTNARTPLLQLLNSTTLEVLWEQSFSVPFEYRDGIAFHPNGNVFLVAGTRVDRAPVGAPNELAVYLYR